MIIGYSVAYCEGLPASAFVWGAAWGYLLFLVRLLLPLVSLDDALMERGQVGEHFDDLISTVLLFLASRRLSRCKAIQSLPGFIFLYWVVQLMGKLSESLAWFAVFMIIFLCYYNFFVSLLIIASGFFVELRQLPSSIDQNVVQTLNGLLINVWLLCSLDNCL